MQKEDLDCEAQLLSYVLTLSDCRRPGMGCELNRMTSLTCVLSFISYVAGMDKLSERLDGDERDTDKGSDLADSSSSELGLARGSTKHQPFSSQLGAKISFPFLFFFLFFIKKHLSCHDPHPGSKPSTVLRCLFSSEETLRRAKPLDIGNLPRLRYL